MIPKHDSCKLSTRIKFFLFSCFIIIHNQHFIQIWIFFFYTYKMTYLCCKYNKNYRQIVQVHYGVMCTMYMNLTIDVDERYACGFMHLAFLFYFNCNIHAICKYLTRFTYLLCNIYFLNKTKNTKNETTNVKSNRKQRLVSHNVNILIIVLSLNIKNVEEKMIIIVL